MNYLTKAGLLIAISFYFISPSKSCTSYLVTKGASVDGSTMITYAADSHIRYGELYWRPAKEYPIGATIKLYDRGTYKFIGEIPQVRKTYQVIGFTNEHQVSIGESTFGGKSELYDSTGMVDYGSLMFLSMQRAKTAREAIKVIAELVEKYGYYSSGESFSISDKNEVWIMEIIGKGMKWEYDKKLKQNVNVYKGAIWVAVRIPDGYISAHANQARIRTFTLENGTTSITDKQFDKINNPSVEVIYKSDIISFSRERKYFTGKDSEFSFSDIYNPVDFGSARFCEARVWAFFKSVNKDMWQFFDYAKGENLKNRMPLYIKPDRKIIVQDLFNAKRDHLEGTDLDMSKDFGAGPFAMPYRWRPMTWTVDGKEYFHERTTATQQTAFSYVAQARSWMPDPIGGILWFGVDDASATVYVPFYCGIKKIAPSFIEGNGNMLEYSETAAFWIFSRVSNFAYLRYDLMMYDVKLLQKSLEQKHFDAIAVTDKAALELFKTNPDKALDYLTNFSYGMAENTAQSWNTLSNFLLVKYIDGNVKKEKDGVFLKNEHGFVPSPQQPGYPDWYKKKIAEETGEKFLFLK